jgi:hypothetical protein
MGLTAHPVVSPLGLFHTKSKPAFVHCAVSNYGLGLGKLKASGLG